MLRDTFLETVNIHWANFTDYMNRKRIDLAISELKQAGEATKQERERLQNLPIHRRPPSNLIGHLENWEDEFEEMADTLSSIHDTNNWLNRRGFGNLNI